MTDLIEIKAHANIGREPLQPFHWRDADPALRPDGYPGQNYRTCSYCGCIHPKDLLEALKAGATLGGSDWKYGWPHKYYVYNIPNPNEDMECKRGSSTKNGVETPIMGKVGKGHGKWYNDHLMDFSPEDFEEFTKILNVAGGIEWFLDPEKGVGYRAPYAGYQHDPKC